MLILAQGLFVNYRNFVLLTLFALQAGNILTVNTIFQVDGCHRKDKEHEFTTNTIHYNITANDTLLIDASNSKIIANDYDEEKVNICSSIVPEKNTTSYEEQKLIICIGDILKSLHTSNISITSLEEFVIQTNKSLNLGKKILADEKLVDTFFIFNDDVLDLTTIIKNDIPEDNEKPNPYDLSKDINSYLLDPEALNCQDVIKIIKRMGISGFYDGSNGYNPDDARAARNGDEMMITLKSKNFGFWRTIKVKPPHEQRIIPETIYSATFDGVGTKRIEKKLKYITPISTEFIEKITAPKETDGNSSMHIAGNRYIEFTKPLWQLILAQKLQPSKN